LNSAGQVLILYLHTLVCTGAYEPPQREGAPWTSVPILCRITLQNAPYMLLVLMSFEVTTVTSTDSQEPACCDDGHLLAS